MAKQHVSMPDGFGYVYILSNPAMPGIIKIGSSKFGAQIRARQLYATGVPQPFVIEFEATCFEPDTVEAELHELFSDRRVNGSREFFRVEPGEAEIAAYSLVGSQFGAEVLPAHMKQMKPLARRFGLDVETLTAALDGLTEFEMARLVKRHKDRVEKDLAWYAKEHADA